MARDFKITRTLHNGLKIPSLGFTVTDPADHRLQQAVHNGIRLFELPRDSALLTPFAQVMRDTGLQRFDCPLILHIPRSVHTYDETMYFLKRCLKAMQTKYIDILLADCENGEAYSQVWKAMEDLYKSGDVHAIGTSDCPAQELERLLNISEISVMITTVPFYPGHPESELMKYTQEHRIHVLTSLPAQEVSSSRELGIFAEKYSKDPQLICMRYQADRSALLLLSEAVRRPEEYADALSFELSKDDTLYLDNMKDYGIPE